MPKFGMISIAWNTGILDERAFTGNGKPDQWLLHEEF